MQQDERAQPTILVLGGNGFIGRYLCAELEKQGALVLIGTRAQSALAKPRCLAPDERRVVMHKMRHAEQWQPALQGVDVVINAVGILRQRLGESYEQVHHQALGELATACAKNQVRLVHLSALGLGHPVKSRFTRSKRAGEWSLMNSNADWHIVRASLVDGPEGYGASWFRKVASWPIHITPVNANGRMAPIRAEDLAACMAKVALQAALVTEAKQLDGSRRIYDVAGPQRVSLLQYLAMLKGKAPMAQLKIPAWFTRTVAHLCDVLHWSPLSFGHYELLQYDNCPTRDRTVELLGRLPLAVEANCSESIKGSLDIGSGTAST